MILVESEHPKKLKPSILICFFGEGSSRLCLDYILGNFVIKLRPSETKPGHIMLASGFEP